MKFLVEKLVQAAMKSLRSTGPASGTIARGVSAAVARKIGQFQAMATWFTLQISATYASTLAKLTAQAIGRVGVKGRQALLQAVRKRMPEMTIRQHTLVKDLTRALKEMSPTQRAEFLMYLTTIGVATRDVWYVVFTEEGAIENEDVEALTDEEFDELWTSAQKSLPTIQFDASADGALEDDVMTMITSPEGRSFGVLEDDRNDSQEVNEAAMERVIEIRNNVSALRAAFGTMYDVRRVLHALRTTTEEDLELYRRFEERGWPR